MISYDEMLAQDAVIRGSFGMQKEHAMALVKRALRERYEKQKKGQG